MINTLMVPIDGSEPAMTGLSYATELAKKMDADILAFYVLDESEDAAHLINSDRIRIKLKKEQREVLKRAEEMCRGEGVKFTKKDAERLARFGRHAGLAVDSAGVYEELEEAYEAG